MEKNTLLGLALAATVTAMPSLAQAAPAHAGARAHFEEVATFAHQVTGITVARDGRMFVNFPRWTEDAPVSVAELLPNGELRPYPNEDWNAWRNAKRDEITPGDHWVCVQSVVADKRGSLWVIDPGAPAQALVVPGAPKLVKIDLASNQVAQVFPFDERIAPQGSYLNDVRPSPDGRFVYITDSGVRGAIVVVDTSSGQARRVLDGDPSTQVEKGVVVKSDGKPLRRPDGRGVDFSADGIELSPDGAYLYWHPVKGKTLYRIPTTALLDTALSAQQVSERVERVGEDGPADGLLMDEHGNLYLTAVEDHAVKVRDRHGVHVLAHDPAVRWPDTFSQGPDGTIYVTDSRIPDMTWFNPENPPALPTRLLRIRRDR